MTARFLCKEVVDKKCSGLEILIEGQVFGFLESSTITDLFKVGGGGLHEIIAYDPTPAHLNDGTIATEGTVYVSQIIESNSTET